MTGIGFDFLAKLVDEDAEVFGFLTVIWPPDPLGEAAMAPRIAPDDLAMLGRLDHRSPDGAGAKP